MPYCQTTLLIGNQEDIEPTLSLFAQENFVQGQAAYHLGNNRFLVDAGENDLRAVFDEDERLIKFFCRYDGEKARYEKMLMSFAKKHDLKTGSLTT